MKIIADENIPLVYELFGSLGEIVTLPGRNISPEDVKHADALLVRSVTQVNETLLQGSQVKFVGTCTIGTDHLDKEYLDKQSISYSSAPGCNAYGVVQYVFAALAHLNKLDKTLKIGVIGCGNVGGRLYRALIKAGFSCVCYDPFLTQNEIPDLQPWESLYECDVICTHTPLTTDGPHPSWHMMSTEFFNHMKPGALLLNAGRGAVIDNDALLQYFRQGNQNKLSVVLDVWEPEPDLDTALLEYVCLASPHIAGYSYEGKTNGSLMIFEALSTFLQHPENDIKDRMLDVKTKAYGDTVPLTADSVREMILKTYPIVDDDARLRAVKDTVATEFDLLRKHYPKRREFSHYSVIDPADDWLDFYEALGFKIQMTA